MKQSKKIILPILFLFFSSLGLFAQYHLVKSASFSEDLVDVCDVDGEILYAITERFIPGEKEGRDFEKLQRTVRFSNGKNTEIDLYENIVYYDKNYIYTANEDAQRISRYRIIDDELVPDGKIEFFMQQYEIWWLHTIRLGTNSVSFLVGLGCEYEDWGIRCAKFQLVSSDFEIILEYTPYQNMVSNSNVGIFGEKAIIVSKKSDSEDGEHKAIILDCRKGVIEREKLIYLGKSLIVWSLPFDETLFLLVAEYKGPFNTRYVIYDNEFDKLGEMKLDSIDKSISPWMRYIGLMESTGEYYLPTQNPVGLLVFGDKWEKTFFLDFSQSCSTKLGAYEHYYEDLTRLNDNYFCFTTGIGGVRFNRMYYRKIPTKQLVSMIIGDKEVKQTFQYPEKVGSFYVKRINDEEFKIISGGKVDFYKLD